MKMLKSKNGLREGLSVNSEGKEKKGFLETVDLIISKYKNFLREIGGL